MTSRTEANLITTAIKSLPDTFWNCREIAAALIDTNQRVMKVHWWGKLRGITDYERTRARAMSSVHSLIERLNKLRSKDVRPDIIRATAHLKQIRRSCRNCPQTNARNLAAGKPFVCLAANLSNLVQQTTFRFTLDQRGRIVESK